MNKRTSQIGWILTSVSVLALLLVCMSSQAVTPAAFNQASEADFARGTFNSTVVNSHGEVGLARDVQTLFKGENVPPVIWSLAGDPSGNGKILYAGSGSKNEVYKVEGSKGTLFSQPEGAMICSLLWTSKGLLAGTGGDGAGIYRIDASGKAQALWTDEKVKYVWAIVEGPGGVLYAATGPVACVYSIDADGKATPLYKLPEKLAKNFLCLTAAKSGLLYAGTDMRGLVAEIDPAKKTGRVILDAPEKEITALVVDDKGQVFAATGEAGRASGDGEDMPSHDKPAGLMSPSTGRAPAMDSSRGPATMPASSMPSTMAAKDKDADSEPSTDMSEPDQSATDDSGDDNPDDGEDSGPSHGPMIHGPIHGESGDKGPGNSVYLVQKDGLVRTIFHRPVTILAMAMQDGALVLGTGNSGTIFRVSLDGDRVEQVVKTEAKQVSALAAGKDGTLAFATSNKGAVAQVAQAFAAEGTFVSRVFDAKQISKWGSLRIAAKAPSGTTVQVSTRSGNLSEAEDATWSQWTKDQPVEEGFMAIDAPSARYLQYRLKFTSNVKNDVMTPGQVTPLVSRVSIIHQVGNLAPEIESVQVQVTGGDGQSSGPSRGPSRGPVSTKGGGDSEEKGAKFMRNIQIQATDANNDQMVYAIYFRAVGSENWIKIADKLTEAQHAWDTRTVGDGNYELKIMVSDSPSNPPAGALETSRVTQPVVVDNTPPVLKELAAKLDGKQGAVTGLAVDASRIASIHFAVDSQEDWVAVLPTSGICATNSEKFDFHTKDLSEGAHRIAVKVEDIYGNTGYGAVTVTVGK